MIQSNWICKSRIIIPAGCPHTEGRDLLAPGHLRAVTWHSFDNGTARRILWRIPQMSLAAGIMGEVGDWIPVAADPTHYLPAVYFCDMHSAAAIDFFYIGDANADSPAMQFSFWYQPSDADDDSHLSPMGNQTRGGVKA